MRCGAGGRAGRGGASSPSCGASCCSRAAPAVPAVAEAGTALLSVGEGSSSPRQLAEQPHGYQSGAAVFFFFNDNTFETKLVICLQFVGQCENLL